LDYSKLFIFSGLDDKSIKNISLTFPKTQTFKKGEIIYSADTFKNAIGFVINGSVVAVANNHNEVLLKNFAPNMCFGVAAIFGGGDNYVSTITAKTDCEILFLSEEFVKQVEMLGNECAWTDRKVEQILAAANRLQREYDKI
jgi:CRP-like cAMP-binding protein